MKEREVKRIKLIISVLALFCFLVLLPQTFLLAEDIPDYKLLAPLPGMSGDTGVDAGDYLTTLFYVGIGIAGVLAVIMITIGGLQYMTTEAISGKSSAKSRINNAIFGLILALASFVLLETINTDFVNPSLEIEPVGKPGTIQTDPTEEVWGGLCRIYGTVYQPWSDSRSAQKLLAQTYIKTDSGETCGLQCEAICEQINLAYDEDQTEDYCDVFRIDCEKSSGG